MLTASTPSESGRKRRTQAIGRHTINDAEDHGQGLDQTRILNSRYVAVQLRAAAVALEKLDSTP